VLFLSYIIFSNIQRSSLKMQWDIDPDNRRGAMTVFKHFKLDKLANIKLMQSWWPDQI